MPRRRGSFFYCCVALLATSVAMPAAAAEGSRQDARTDTMSGQVRLAQAETAARESGAENRKFRAWVKRFRATARRAGIRGSTYDRAMAVATFDPSVLESAAYQPEFVKPIWDYIDSAVSQSRVENGRRKLSELRPVLDRIEQRFGVDREVVLAIWGMESAYGEVLDDPDVVEPVVSSLGTLAYAGGRRAKFGRTQLIAALKIIQKGDVDPDHMTGSWAGAMGHTQFIPTTYLAHAVDIDGDGKRNIWTSIPDALASTANYLRASGWRKGETWGYEVTVPDDFDTGLAEREVSLSFGEWAQRGVRRTKGRSFPASNRKAYLYLPTGTKGPGFLILPNFRAILRYNNANSYALAVGHLADRIGGGGPLAQAWPRETYRLPLARKSHRRELQTLLAEHGADPGTADGLIGPKTRAAIRSVQSRLGLPEDGRATVNLLKRLRAEGQ